MAQNVRVHYAQEQDYNMKFLPMSYHMSIALKIGCCGDGDEDSYDFADAGNDRRRSIRSTTRRKSSALEMADFKNEA